MRGLHSDAFSNLGNNVATFFPTVPVDEVPKTDSFADANAYRPMVLVAGDEPGDADTLVEILNQNGYAAVAAYDGESALDTALLMPPELLIADVVLPGMSGIDLAIALDGKFPDCKILLLAEQALTIGLPAAANREGHQFALLDKPAQPGDLLASVAASLNLSNPQPILNDA
jgi:CheY-like chemotaxis protein